MRPLEARLATTRFEGPHHEAILALLLASSRVRERLEAALAPLGLTRAQFNVLRILRGARPGGHARGEIARRLLERAPDVTRLLDRLARRGWIERVRPGGDRRLAVSRITPSGLALLGRADRAVAAVRREVAGRLSGPEARSLARLAEKLFA